MLAAEKAKHPDDIELDPIATWGFGGDDLYAYPCMEVAVPDLVMANFSLAQLHADTGMRVLLRCSVTDATSDRIYRKTLRYYDAIMGVLMQPAAFGAGLVIHERGVQARWRQWNLEIDPNRVDLFGAVLIEVW